MPGTTTCLSCNNQKCLQTLLNVPWKIFYPQGKIVPGWELNSTCRKKGGKEDTILDLIKSHQLIFRRLGASGWLEPEMKLWLDTCFCFLFLCIRFISPDKLLHKIGTMTTSRLKLMSVQLCNKDGKESFPTKFSPKALKKGSSPA